MLQPGDTAPPFTLTDQNNEEHSLESLLRRGPLVLYFYPADFTPGCTAQACAMRDRRADLEAAGATVVGVSAQSGSTHDKFESRFKLGFTLLSDPGRAVAKQYGAVGLGGVLPLRVTYLLDPDGTVADAVRADLAIGKHAAFADRVLERLRGTQSATT
ncbi:MAG: peroxiredoxin [Planctomycetota bacterium]